MKKTDHSLVNYPAACSEGSLKAVQLRKQPGIRSFSVCVGLKGNGFTFIELVTVIAILAILSAVAIPFFSTWLPNYRLKSASQDLVSNMQLAKLTAIKRNTNCVITFNSNNYTVFVDSNDNQVYDTGETIITTKQLADYKDVSYNGITFSHTPPSVAFQPNGLPTESGDVYFKNTKGKTTKVDLNAAGVIQIQ